jgi:hypothetical protein
MSDLPMAEKMALASVAPLEVPRDAWDRMQNKERITPAELGAALSSPHNAVEAMKATRPKYAGVWLVEKQRARATARPSAFKLWVARTLLGFGWEDSK